MELLMTSSIKGGASHDGQRYGRSLSLRPKSLAGLPAIAAMWLGFIF